MISLREHQVEANARIRAWAGFPTRSPVPAQGLRGTVVSATGSGKTITAAWAARECFRGGRILVMVPTLDLLVQTAQAWRRVGHHGPMAAVCSLEKDEILEQHGVRTTTNPIQLALWAGHGPVVVFATYASLVDREDPEDVTGRAKVRGPLEAARPAGNVCTDRQWPRSTSPSSTKPTQPPAISAGRGQRSTTTPASPRTSGSI